MVGIMLMNKEDIEKYITETYLPKIKEAKAHPAKVLVITEFLRDVFDVELIELLPGIEKKVRSKVLGVRGSMDLFFTDVVFEVKTNLDREIKVGEEELKKYFQALIEDNPKKKYVGIITDGIVFKTYLPIVKDNVVEDIRLIDEIDLTKISPSDAILWFDSF